MSPDKINLGRLALSKPAREMLVAMDISYMPYMILSFYNKYNRELNDEGPLFFQ